MKKINLKTVLSSTVVILLAVAIFLTGVFFVQNVAYAGVSPEKVAEKISSDGSSIDEGIWWLPAQNRGVSYSDGIVFSNLSTASSRVVARTKVFNLKNAGFTKFLSADIDFQITSLPEGCRFGVFFGLSSQTSNPAAGGADTSFIYFALNGEKLMCGVSKYSGTERTETQVLPAADTAEWIINKTKSFKLRMAVDVDGGIKINLLQALANQNYFYSNSQAALFTEGYIGFGQTLAGGVIKISQAQIDALSNSTPQNANVFTRFENGNYSINAFHTRSRRDESGLSYVSPDNGELVFKNTTVAFLSTKLSYSNFEMDIELPYIQRAPLFDENLNLISSISTGFAISAGAPRFDAMGGDFRVNFIPTGGSLTRKPTATEISVVRQSAELMRIKLPPEYHIWNEQAAAGRSVDIKAVMQDGSFTLYLKYSGQLNYYKALKFDNGYVPTGYIQVSSLVQGNVRGRCDNFSLSLVSVVNTDYNCQIISLTNKSSSSIAVDYDYTDSWNDDDLLWNQK